MHANQFQSYNACACLHIKPSLLRALQESLTSLSSSLATIPSSFLASSISLLSSPLPTFFSSWPSNPLIPQKVPVAKIEEVETVTLEDATSILKRRDSKFLLEDKIKGMESREMNWASLPSLDSTYNSVSSSQPCCSLSSTPPSPTPALPLAAVGSYIDKDK